MGGRRELAALIATASLVGTTIPLNLPLLSLGLERAGFAADAIGLNAAASGLGVLLAVPLLAPLHRRLGSRGTIAAGAAVAALAMLVLPLRVDFLFWFLLRMVVSAGTALVFIVAEATINALAPQGQRARVLAVYATVFCLAYASGPLVIVLLGSEGYLPFAVSAGLFLLGAWPAAAARGIDAALDAPPANLRLADGLAIFRRAPLAFLTILVFGVLEASLFSLFPVYALAFGYGEGTAALMLSVWILGNVLLQYPIAWLADRWPRHTVLGAVAAVVLCGFLLLPVAMASGLAPWPLLVLLGGFAGALYTLSLALIGDACRGFALALANAAFVVMIELGMTLGPPLSGLAMGSAGPHGLPLFLAAACAPLLIAALRPRSRRLPGRRLGST